ncbi:hypothetical protein J3R30DRAFT_1578479 [Lentinula aciculospora]|uniref:Uncharacterized protein n=1 Tax=Lentinula aciculospora TaxID=153920 RepID=A0A9W8ZYS6_9AGAR|nr:hypothetical protein J3R30DRAFT_1578479 [Lentinula aciculospora]
MKRIQHRFFFSSACYQQATKTDSQSYFAVKVYSENPDARYAHRPVRRLTSQELCTSDSNSILFVIGGQGENFDGCLDSEGYCVCGRPFATSSRPEQEYFACLRPSGITCKCIPLNFPQNSLRRSPSYHPLTTYPMPVSLLMGTISPDVLDSSHTIPTFPLNKRVAFLSVE